MEFVTIRLGGVPNIVFAENNRVRVPFTLTRPAATVYPVLQSFRLMQSEGDRHLKGVQIRLVPFFNAGVSATQGEVEFETTLEDSDGGIFVTADLIELDIVALVVAV